MDISELIQSPVAAQEALRNAIKQQIHVSMPGVVHEFDKDTQTATILPAIRDKTTGTFFDLPLLTDVPVFFPGGRDAAMTFPVEPGDECLVVFADSCIDAWFTSGDVQNPVIPRRHDLSDGFAFVGFRSKVNALKGFKNEPDFFGVTPGGGVASVCGVNVDESGNVPLTYDNIPSAPQIRTGRITTGTVTKNSYVDVTGFTFDPPFPSGSAVVVTLNPVFGGNGILGGVNVTARNVTSNGFSVRLSNSTDTNVGTAIVADYIAVGVNDVAAMSDFSE